MRKEWQLHALGDVCQMGSGGTPLTSKREYYDGGTIPWLQSGEVAQGEVRTATNFITRAGFENSAARIFPRDTVLVAMYGATAGQVGILRFEASTNQAICGIFPNEIFHPKFLYYALLSKKNELISRAVGNAQPNISQVKIKRTYVPIPPLVEQKRIVIILDEAFEGIATAVANAEKNLASARELFDSYLKSVFTKKGKGWVERKLGDICENLDSRRVPVTKSDRSKGDVPYYGASGIVDYVSGYLFDEDILLISEDGANLLARTYPIAFSVAGKSWVNNHAHVVRFSRSETQKIVELYLNSISLAAYVSGMAQPKLNQKSLNAIIITIPPIAEQAHIVEAAETLQAGIERLEAIYQEKLKALADLKQALLQKAFAGELTARSAEAVQEAAE